MSLWEAQWCSSHQGLDFHGQYQQRWLWVPPLKDDMKVANHGVTVSKILLRKPPYALLGCWGCQKFPINGKTPIPSRTSSHPGHCLEVRKLRCDGYPGSQERGVAQEGGGAKNQIPVSRVFLSLALSTGKVVGQPVLHPLCQLELQPTLPITPRHSE